MRDKAETLVTNNHNRFDLNFTRVVSETQNNYGHTARKQLSQPKSGRKQNPAQVVRLAMRLFVEV